MKNIIYTMFQGYPNENKRTKTPDKSPAASLLYYSLLNYSIINYTALYLPRARLFHSLARPILNSTFALSNFIFLDVGSVVCYSI